RAPLLAAGRADARPPALRPDSLRPVAVRTLGRRRAGAASVARAARALALALGLALIRFLPAPVLPAGRGSVVVTSTGGRPRASRSAAARRLALRRAAPLGRL